MTDVNQTLHVHDDQEIVPQNVVHMGAVIGERYRIDERIAVGGMATVFLATDLRHERHVAVKVMHQTLAHAIGIQRFLREIEVIARMQHPHLLTLIDSGTINGYPYYVMPYMEAHSLRELITERKHLALEDAITIAREVADGLAYAHERGVVHRDIKPSNILMSDGHAVVVDFGIATAIRKSSIGSITVAGTSMGSPTYMSPEQAAGEQDVDARSDMYSLACVVFEMLTGEPPFDSASMQQVFTQKLTGGVKRVRELRPDLPASIDDVLGKALAPNRDERYATLDEFSKALISTLPSAAVVATRTRFIAAAVVLVILGAGAVYVQQQRRIVRATQQLAEIGRLARAAQLHDAFTLTEKVLPILPHDSTLASLRPLYTDFLKIVTVPSGARVSVQRIGNSDSSWRDVGVTPLDSLPMPRLMHEMGYRMRFVREGYDTVDVMSALFTNTRRIGGALPLDTLFLDRAGLPTSGMARVRGFATTGRSPIRTADYHIGKREVTNREYRRFVEAGGYQKREYWTEPMQQHGKPVTWEQGVAQMMDRTGQPGPGTWRGGTYADSEAEFPVGGVSWYEASAYARFAGMQLPTLEHWSKAAMRSSREVLWMYIRTSNLNGTGVRRAGLGTANEWGLYDVAGNVREWCVNAIDSGRVTRGGTWEDSPFHISHLIAPDAFDRSPGNGFRVASIPDPDSVVVRLSQPIRRSVPRDFRNVAPVSDVAFESIRRMFDYDARPLESKLETEGETREFRWQRVSFSAAYAGPRMVAYLYFPKNGQGPFEPVIYWGAANVVQERRFVPETQIYDAFANFIPQSGRALVVPMYMGSYERDDSTFSITATSPDTTTSYRDLQINRVNDLRRTIDFLEQRPDMRTDHIGFYGVSWGGQQAPLALAIEPRIKAAALYSAGYIGSMARRETEAFNYTPRVHQPVLMLNGRYDTVFPFETSQVPFFNQLGTPARDKKMEVSENGHIVPLPTTVKETLAWFDRYLSGK